MGGLMKSISLGRTAMTGLGSRGLGMAGTNGGHDIGTGGLEDAQVATEVDLDSM